MNKDDGGPAILTDRQAVWLDISRCRYWLTQWFFSTASFDGRDEISAAIGIQNNMARWRRDMVAMLAARKDDHDGR